MRKSKLDALPVKKEKAKRLATGESQSSIAKDMDVNHSTISRFSRKEDVQKLIEEETLKLLEVIPDAIVNMKTLVKDMNRTPKKDHKNRELSFKASLKVLESAGIMNSPTQSQVVVNVLRTEKQILTPFVSDLIDRHLRLGRYRNDGKTGED